MFELFSHESVRMLGKNRDPVLVKVAHDLVTARFKVIGYFCEKDSGPRWLRWWIQRQYLCNVVRNVVNFIKVFSFVVQRFRKTKDSQDLIFVSKEAIPS